jgi:hypothetical protein
MKDIGMIATDRPLNQAAIGMQRHLEITAVPSGAEGNLINKRLIDAGALVVAGDYYCRFYIGGCANAECHLTATFGGGETLTSQVYKTWADGDKPDVTAVTAKEDFASDGAMVSTTKQTSTITDLLGEQYAVAKLTITGTGGVTFTRAEVNGA